MESATDIMNEYLESVGGRDFVPQEVIRRTEHLPPKRKKPPS